MSAALRSETKHSRDIGGNMDTSHMLLPARESRCLDGAYHTQRHFTQVALRRKLKRLCLENRRDQSVNGSDSTRSSHQGLHKRTQAFVEI